MTVLGAGHYVRVESLQTAFARRARKEPRQPFPSHDLDCGICNTLHSFILSGIATTPPTACSVGRISIVDTFTCAGASTA